MTWKTSAPWLWGAANGRERGYPDLFAPPHHNLNNPKTHKLKTITRFAVRNNVFQMLFPSISADTSFQFFAETIAKQISDVTSQLFWTALPYLTLPHLTSPYLPLPYLNLPYLTSPYLILPHLTTPHLTLSCLTLPYLTLPGQDFVHNELDLCRNLSTQVCKTQFLWYLPHLWADMTPTIAFTFGLTIRLAIRPKYRPKMLPKGQPKAPATCRSPGSGDNEANKM